MRLLIRPYLFVVVAALAVAACTEPQQKHRDAGAGDAPAVTDGPKDSDVPIGDGADADADAGNDSPMVVTAQPGSVATGKPCSKDGDCGSGFCRDDVCCESACEGLCNACSMSFTNLENGKCGPVSAGMDPRGVCTDDSAKSPCGQDGTCDGKGACRKQGPDHICSQASCSADNSFTPAGTCDGNGTCVAGMVMACGTNPCALTGCAKPCTADGDCPAGNFCSNGTCKVTKIAGDSCDSGTQCASGNCSPDKVCCDTACTGACTACTEALTGQKNGTCAPVQSGKDPKDDCTAEAPKSCGHDGTCDGKGGCRYYDSSASCSDASCSGTMFSPAGACDSKGACAPVTPVDCGQTMCTLNGCKKSCAADADCAAGSYCVTATMACAPKKSNGLACGSSTECTSGACVDGVCCESACQGKCYACSAEKTGQTNGRCLPISAGSDPDSECASSDQTTCGQDGTCDGHGQCRKWASGTQCAAAMCTTDNKYLATRTCDGAGTCAAATPQDCGGSACALSGCKKTCAGNQDCSGNNYCDSATSICTAQKNLGATCNTGVECLSQSCVDGVCCESACQGKCYACSSNKTGQAAGRCQPITMGTDPDNECDSSDPTTCGQNGSCDGKGQCARWPAATMCGAATCNNNQFQPARGCDGSGTCVAPPPQDCGATVCSASGCSTSCADDSGCFGNNYCDTTNKTCATKKNLGGPCVHGNECLSTFCAPDGVCCNNACTGKCNACVKEKTGLATSGTCGAIPAGSDPDNECSSTDVATCGQDGACDGNGQCRKWASGTQCAAGMCSSNKYTPASTCDGNGACVTPAAQDCTPNICGANGCPKTCNTATDCASGNYCDDGTHMCTPLKSLGTPCVNSKECLMGICADNVCCNAACGNACQACNLSNSKGTCTLVGSPVAGHPTCAGADAACGGSCAGSADGQCTFPTGNCGTCRRCLMGTCTVVRNQNDSSCSTMCDANGACPSPAMLALTVAPGSSVDFGHVVIGTPVDELFVVANNGQQPSSQILVILSGSDFNIPSLSPGDCLSGSTILAPGAACTIRVRFNPSVAMRETAVLSVSANSGGVPPALNLVGIGKYKTGTIIEFQITFDRKPVRIVGGPDGNVWFTEYGGNSIGRITPTGVITYFPIPTPKSNPYGIAVGPDGNIWFTEADSNKVGYISTSGAFSEFQAPANSVPLNISSGPDGAMWIIESGVNRIGRVTPTGSISEFTIPTTNSSPYGIVTGPDGRIWFTETSANKIGSLSVSGQFTEYNGLVNGSPRDITSGPDGNLWFTDGTRVGKITVNGAKTEFGGSGTVVAVDAITVGPDSNLWFAEEIGIDRISVSGAISQFRFANQNTSFTAAGICSGPDGNVWFTEAPTVGKIGYISP